MDRDQVYVFDILEAAHLATSYVRGVSEDEFLSDTQLQDSVIRRIEIIGEAARRVSDQMKTDHPEIPWGEMIGMRNLMIHEYGAVDLIIVWQTVCQSLPSLIEQLETLLPPKEV